MRQAAAEHILDVIMDSNPQRVRKHVLVYGPRGIGKSRILLMTELGMQDRDRNANWVIVRTPEELFSVSSFADFLLEVIEIAALRANDVILKQMANKVVDGDRDQEHVCSTLIALLIKWLKQNDKRVVILLDNVENVLSVANATGMQSEFDSLLEHEAVRLVAAAPLTNNDVDTRRHSPRTGSSSIGVFRNMSQGFSAMFETIRLEAFTDSEIRIALERIAEMDGNRDVCGSLQDAVRLRSLGYFTGGNIRLVLMLYDVIAKYKQIDIVDGVQRLLDHVTPYYLARVGALAPQQRKILDCIARGIFDTREGVSPSAVAARLRISLLRDVGTPDSGG